MKWRKETKWTGYYSVVTLAFFFPALQVLPLQFIILVVAALLLLLLSLHDGFCPSRKKISKSRTWIYTGTSTSLHFTSGSNAFPPPASSDCSVLLAIIGHVQQGPGPCVRDQRKQQLLNESPGGGGRTNEQISDPECQLLSRPDEWRRPRLTGSRRRSGDERVGPSVSQSKWPASR